MDLLFLIGLVLVLGLIGGKIFNKFKFPAVVGYLIIGIFLGPSVFGLFKLDLLDRMGIITDFALGIIAFIIGNELRWGILKKFGGKIITILFVQAIATFILITFGVWLLTHNFALSLILGSLGVATAPAGTVAVLQEFRAKGPLTTSLLAIVGLDDGLALIIYGFASALAMVSIGGSQGINFQNILEWPLLRISGAVVLGILLGLALSYVVRKRHDKNEILTWSLGAVLICAGLANILNFSLILTTMALGMTVANIFSLSGRRTFEAIQSITNPIYIAFFVLAGAHLQMGLLPKMGLLGLVYILARALGKIGGASLGAHISKAETNMKKYLGFGLLSQAGVAIGLAMIVQREFGVYGELATVTITIITATTIIHEILGPVGVKYAIAKAGEIGHG
ncbi:cation:proton antiporter [bacterium]|nr:cation:proton antiporter [bacterium]NIN91859.1 cation:proton antiporter [bacterium]NIO18133.1 cation:proton antiporter [bacterium]NIO73105.1 cation:proton antiporter [bacterium]